MVAWNRPLRKPLQILLLTRLVAVLVEEFGALGIYWDSAPLVHSPAAFCESAREMSLNTLPLRLWVDFRLIPEAEGTHSLATFGLAALGQMEIEIASSRRAPTELLGWAFNLAHHLLEGGVIKDDQTFGTNDVERILVRHESSMFTPQRTVYSLKL